MDSVMELLVKKQHPEYTKDEVWEEVWSFFENNSKKIELFLKRYEFPAGTEGFEKKRKRFMELLCSIPRYDFQWMLRYISNFEAGMLWLLSDEAVEEKLRSNISKRLESVIGAEAYVVVKKLNPDEKMFDLIMDKWLAIYHSKEMQARLKEREEEENNKRIQMETAPLEQKNRWLLNEVAMHSIFIWNKKHEPVRLKVLPYYFITDGLRKQFSPTTGSLIHHSYEEGLQGAYRFSEWSKGRLSLVSSGLMLDEENNLVYVSYIIRQKDGEKRIYRCTNELTLFPEIPEEIEGDRLVEVTEEEFFRYCEVIYGKAIKW